MHILSYSNEDRLFQAIDPKSPFGYRDKQMILLDLATGLRVAELVGLQVQHVLCAKPNGQPGRMVRHELLVPAELGKFGRERLIPLNTEARQAVAQIVAFNRAGGFSVAPQAPLFPNRAHRAMSARAAQRMLAGYRQKADMDVPITPHSLRHSLATRLIEQDVPTHKVQKIMGHRKLASTERYLHASPDQLGQCMQRISRVPAP